jgi:DNA-binding GntR family transcriptional regulator
MAAKFAPGEHLTVRGVAKSLGVSSMPVRAAFMRLVAEKIVDQNSSGTILIPSMTKERYRELILLRALLEGKAAEIAASKMTEAGAKKLKKIGNALTKASLDGDPDAYLSLNQRFKFAVVAAAEAPVLADLVERLWLQVGPFMRFYHTDVRAQHDLDKHLDAIEALERGDGPAARQAIETDILEGADFLFKNWKESIA